MKLVELTVHALVGADQHVVARYYENFPKRLFGRTHDEVDLLIALKSGWELTRMYTEEANAIEDLICLQALPALTALPNTDETYTIARQINDEAQRRRRSK